MSEPELVTESVATAVGTVRITHGGPPDAARSVVYLHSSGGETGEAEVARFLTLLAEDYRVYAPMLPGFAGSEGLDQIDDIEDAVYHTLDLFDRLGLGADEPPHLAGMSLGGWLAAEIAWRHPERLRTLTLINAVGLHLPEAPMKELFGKRPDELAAAVFFDQDHPVATAMRLLGSIPAKELANVPFDAVRPFYESMAAAAKIGWSPYFHNPKMRRRLPRISAPTLVIVGRRDGLVPNAVGEEYARLIEGARLEYVEDGSHMLTLENPEIVARLMVDLIEG